MDIIVLHFMESEVMKMTSYFLYFITLFWSVEMWSISSGTPIHPKIQPANKDYLTSEDFARAKTISRKDLEDGSMKTVVNSGYYGGDMNLRGHPIEAFADGVQRHWPSTTRTYFVRRPQYSAIRGRSHRWRNGVVPYTISSGYDSSQRAKIAAAIADYHRYTCIRWVPRTSQMDFVRIAPGYGCYSEVGRYGGPQVLSLGKDCMAKFIIIHEMMHVLGFFHEHNRPDRNNYIEIAWENLEDGADQDFEKLSRSEIDNLGVPYDYESVMHYERDAASRNGFDTIIAPDHVAVSNTYGLTEKDKLKINLLYKCQPQADKASHRISSSEGYSPAEQRPISSSLSSEFESSDADYDSEYSHGESSGSDSELTDYEYERCSDNYDDCDYRASEGDCDDLEFRKQCQYSCEDC